MIMELQSIILMLLKFNLSYCLFVVKMNAYIFILTTLRAPLREKNSNFFWFNEMRSL